VSQASISSTITGTSIACELLSAVVRACSAIARFRLILVDNAATASVDVRGWRTRSSRKAATTGERRFPVGKKAMRSLRGICFAQRRSDWFAKDTCDRMAHRGYLDSIDRALVGQERSLGLRRSVIATHLTRSARLLASRAPCAFRKNIFLHPKRMVDRCCRGFPVAPRETVQPTGLGFSGTSQN